MGMIARLKVGYKLEMLQRLVAIFDLDGKQPFPMAVNDVGARDWPTVAKHIF